MEVAAGAPLPDEFPSVPGAVFPMYHVLRAMADFRQGEVHPVALSHPLRIQAVALQSGKKQLWIVANVTGIPQRIHLPHGGRARLLDDATAARVAAQPDVFWSMAAPEIPGGESTLAPWAVLFLEVAEGSLW
jgi:hypothetical protein